MDDFSVYSGLTQAPAQIATIRITAPLLLRLSWSPGLTGAILLCSYRLWLANCGTAVVSY
jgi:hypothetical protein